MSAGESFSIIILFFADEISAAPAAGFSGAAEDFSPELLSVLFACSTAQPPVIKAEEKARITALACSDAPAGHARWTLRLLADKAVEMGYIEAISHMEVSRLLKKTLSSHTNKNSGASGK